MASDVRVRFAPSPTGFLHIGGLRSAIFNWLFARHCNGKFMIRIEDTDRERSTQEYEKSIIDSFKWIGIESDEPIFRQSERSDAYIALVNNLLESGNAYKCYCAKRSTEELEAVLQGKSQVKYDRTCLNSPILPQDSSKPYVVRFKIPYENDQVFSFNDLIYGEVSFPIDQFDDFIILRSTGEAVYNFVVVADDIYQKITHVIRGQDHLINTPKQIMLYQALGAKVPLFAHLPLILGPSGAKLSKREAAVSVINYKEEGFLPDALFNYLVKLGWSYKDQEIFTREELIEKFNLDSINRAGAVFDTKKLLWVNSVYIKAMDSRDILEYVTNNMSSSFVQNLIFDKSTILRLIDLYKDRCETLGNLISELSLLNLAPADFLEEDTLDFKNDSTIDLLTLFLKDFQDGEFKDEQSVKDLISKLCNIFGVKLPALAKPLRLALTGKINSPTIFGLISVMPKDVVLYRVSNFIKFLSA